jgi:hypothetical protein
LICCRCGRGVAFGGLPVVGLAVVLDFSIVESLQSGKDAMSPNDDCVGFVSLFRSCTSQSTFGVARLSTIRDVSPWTRTRIHRCPQQMTTLARVSATWSLKGLRNVGVRQFGGGKGDKLPSDPGLVFVFFAARNKRFQCCSRLPPRRLGSGFVKCPVADMRFVVVELSLSQGGS